MKMERWGEVQMSEKMQRGQICVGGVGDWSECYSVKLVDDQSVVE